MYQEEYEERGFPFRDFLLKLILIIIFIALLIWILPKFIRPNVKNKCTGNNCVVKTTAKDFETTFTKMKTVATNYYTEDNIKEKTNKIITVEELINNRSLKSLKNKNGKKYNYKDSYIVLKKVEDEYLLKINLKIGKQKDYKVYNLGHYSYCSNYLCEKDSNNAKDKENTPTETPTNDKKENKESTTDKKEETTKDTKTNNTKILYEYEKVTGVKLSAWSTWSAWAKTDCSTKEINCSDSDTNCLKKLQRYNNKETIGTHTKSYVKERNKLTKTGSYNVETCSKNNYVIINNQTYITVGKWILISRNKEFTNAPNDTENYRYEYVGANFNGCKETCNTEPSYYYNVYKYDGSMTKVANT
ncbi:MAG: hypothetical protein E7160_00005, partial [Firmicutes bacterium]|nr:hypothetical protein [Bacillota bacterium]